MMNRSDARYGPHLPVCLLILLAGLCWTVLHGQDVNWDLQNYHDYDPFALLHWRYGRDVAPGGPQSFLNPLPYLLPYGLHRLFPPLAADLLVATAQACCLMSAWFLAWRLCRRPLTALAATATAITGPVVLSELGTSFSDIALAMPPMAALLLLSAPRREPRAGSRLLLAGLLTGIAIGIKPTGLFLLPALASFAAVRERNAAAAVRAAAFATAGTIAGALLSDGAWAWFLWRSYGSPMFPFMNTLFRSHSAALVDFGDPRFHFTGVAHAVRIPFALATGSAATGEVPIRDGRLALGACLALLRLSTSLLRRPRTFEALDGLCAYLLIGLVGWLVLCPIQRYAAVLEILSSLLCALILARLPRRRAADLAMLAASLLLIATTVPGDYFHRPWSSAYQAHVPAAVPAGATYGLLAQPLSYWVTTAPRPAHAFLLSSTLLETGGLLQRRLDRTVRSSGIRLWLLNLDEPVDSNVRAEMGIHAIALAPPCLRAASMIWIDTVFCRGIVTPPRRLAASDLHVGETAAFSTAGYGLIYEIGGFDATEPDGTWAIGPTALLAIHLDPATRVAGATLSLHLAGLGGAPVHTVTIAVGDDPPYQVALGPPAYAATVPLCIPPHAPDDGTLPIVFHTAETRSLAELGISPEPRHLAFKLYDIALHRPASGLCGGRT